jgi:phosphate starvation-inducible protein PhoH and related proteins
MQPARHHGNPSEGFGPDLASDSPGFMFRGFGKSLLPAFLSPPSPVEGVVVSPTPNRHEGGPADPVEYPASGTRRRGSLSENNFQEQEHQMGKRSARFKKPSRDNNDEFQLHALPTGWDPIEERRDQSFIRHVKPRSDGQQLLMEAIDSQALTLALGPAGTGKTYLAIAAAVKALDEGRIDRIVLSRPAIEAGEALGYLPGTMEEKMAPYLRPLYDALADRLGGKRLRQYMSDGTIEIAPIAYMRGRTLNNAFVVIDEAQNCTYVQIKMLLTRLGWHSTMVITGDPDQTDLLPGMSGLADIANKLSTLSDIAVVRLSKVDVVRHPLVACMLAAL